MPYQGSFPSPPPPNNNNKKSRAVQYPHILYNLHNEYTIHNLYYIVEWCDTTLPSFSDNPAWPYLTKMTPYLWCSLPPIYVWYSLFNSIPYPLAIVGEGGYQGMFPPSHKAKMFPPPKKKAMSPPPKKKKLKNDFQFIRKSAIAERNAV